MSGADGAARVGGTTPRVIRGSSAHVRLMLRADSRSGGGRFQVARRARDDFGQLIATGITTWITVQALLNIGGITRTIPLTGVPLPFLSFGSNALASVLLAIGVLLSISRFGTDRGGYFEKHPVDTRRVVRRRPDA